MLLLLLFDVHYVEAVVEFVLRGFVVLIIAALWLQTVARI